MKFFIIHNGGKIEIVDVPPPRTVSYGYEQENLHPRDISYMLEAIYDNIEDAREDDDMVKVVLKPFDHKSAVVVLDIKRRSNINLGVMKLGRFG